MKWFIFIILVLFVLAGPILDHINKEDTTKIKKTEKVKEKKSEIKNNLSEKQKQIILKIVKSEKKVQDAIFPNGVDNLLWVGIYSDGTNRNGYAEYLCVSIKQKLKKLPHDILIEIMDYQKILQKQGFKVIGQYDCK